VADGEQDGGREEEAREKGNAADQTRLLG
jgi:hypothetical protein